MSLIRLLAWMSPAFPVGSFSYSHGLERVVHDGLVKDSAALKDWIHALIAHGSAWNDAVLLNESWRRARDGGDLVELADLAEAMAGSLERHRETVLQGAAFLAAARAWPSPVFDRLAAETAYPVAVGAAAGAHDIAAREATAAFLHAFASNQVQAAIRLGVTGQADGVGVVAALEPAIGEIADRAASSTLDDLGSATMIADIMSMRHETQHSRLFRT